MTHPISEDDLDPEDLWDNMLSRQPGNVRAAYHSLNPAERLAVISHLRRMVAEPGWQQEQRISASQALDALRDLLE
jgi:hypothetical protein